MNGKEVFEKWVLNMKNEGKSDKTVETYSSAISKMFNYFELFEKDILFIEQISKDNFKDFIFSLESLSAGSKNTIIRSISSFLSYLLNSEIISSEKISATKFAGKSRFLDTKKKAVITLTSEEINKIIEASKGIQDEFMFELMLGCGLRENEICELKPEHFKEDGFFEFEGKGGDIYKLRMGERLTRLFYLYMKERDESKTYLFYPVSGKGSKNEQLYCKTPNTRLKAAMSRTDIPVERQRLITSHTLRKTMITAVIKNTKSMEIARQCARHASIATTYLYNNALELGIEAMRNLDVRDMEQGLHS